MQVFGQVPMASLRSNQIVDLDLRKSGLGPTEAIVLASLAGSCRSIRSLDVRMNAFGNEDLKRMRLAMKAAKGTEHSNLNDFALHIDTRKGDNRSFPWATANHRNMNN